MWSVSLLQLLRGLPLRLRCSLSGNAVIWSPECVADPCPFSARQSLSHRCLLCGFLHVSVADTDRPLHVKDSTQAAGLE